MIKRNHTIMEHKTLVHNNHTICLSKQLKNVSPFSKLIMVMMRVPAAHAGVVFVVNQERDSKRGKLLKGIDNWSGTGRSVAQAPKQSL